MMRIRKLLGGRDPYVLHVLARKIEQEHPSAERAAQLEMLMWQSLEQDCVILTPFLQLGVIVVGDDASVDSKFETQVE